MNSLAHKSALVLLYSKSTEIDFGPYNLFASIIQSLFREYILKRRAVVHMQKISKGWLEREFWRECVCDVYCPRNVSRDPWFEYEEEEIAEAVAYFHKTCYDSKKPIRWPRVVFVRPEAIAGARNCDAVTLETHGFFRASLLQAVRQNSPAPGVNECVLAGQILCGAPQLSPSHIYM